ncbi:MULTISPECIES: Shedu anti-phage system protein SduA domain-containing protein [Paenibacillus]|uniref:Shedu anti-phage system protein SduA domain-containing protein n=1 Tax=Paenibacillus TaxID=44249 RepID=UPI00048C5190|nr:Shedu anti-phage system protein SduA domain-containing protein [Paenibacillus sp. IHBB 10380]
MGQRGRAAYSFKEFVTMFGQDMFTNYWMRMWAILDENPHLKDTFPSFLLNPEKLVFYFGKNHMALEYVGSVQKEDLDENYQLTVEIHDCTYTENLMDAVIGFELGNDPTKRHPSMSFNENIYLPSNDAYEILEQNGWNFAAQPMMIGFNIAGLDLIEKSYHRFINCFFYGSDTHGLLVRHIKWLDVFPVDMIDYNDELEQFKFYPWQDQEERARKDVSIVFPTPSGHRDPKLIQLNRFVELFSSSQVTETQITRFLSEPENQFILKMVFFAKELYAEKECVWANDPTRKAIRPDFFITEPNGFSDIVEFKLPNVKTSMIVGRENREAFSAEIGSYIAQTRTYREYFEDPRNRDYVLDKYGIKVHHPKRWLVIGRRWMIESDEWKSIQNDYKEFAIRTYDDLVDYVISMLYS